MKKNNEYLVKNLSEAGKPETIKAASKFKAAQEFAKKYIDTPWKIGVWMNEESWRQCESPTEYYAYELA